MYFLCSPDRNEGKTLQMPRREKVCVLQIIRSLYEAMDISILDAVAFVIFVFHLKYHVIRLSDFKVTHPK